MGKDIQGKDVSKNNYNQKALVFFSAGIGDAVLMVPLLKKLKSSGFHITIFKNSLFIDKEFLKFNQFPYDEFINIDFRFHKFKILSLFKFFDFAFLDYSSSSIKNIFYAFFMSKKLIIHRKKTFPIPSARFLEELPGTHVAVLNVQLFDMKFTNESFDLEMIKLKIQKREKPEIINKIEESGKIPVFVQVSSANMTAKYKNWPIEYWTEFLKKILNKYSDLMIILVGDSNEIEIGKHLKQSLDQSCINVVGNTNLIEACNLLYFSKFYIGLDSGFMHLAVAYSLPTFSIFGASSIDYFGYGKFSKLHKVIYSKVDCWPCLGYKFVNNSKVKNPKLCQEHVCLENIKPELAIIEFIEFFTNVFSSSPDHSCSYSII